jgi:hypothetical protein
MKIYLQLGFLVSSLLITTVLAANDCEYGMGVACPPNLDPQSFVNGLEVQLNGGVGSGDQACPPVSHIYWDWGDSIFEERYFPAYHQYSSAGTYTISVHATDENSEVVADASCTLSLARKIAKVEICHFDYEGGYWVSINISGNAVGAHLRNHDDGFPDTTTSSTGTYLDGNCEEVTLPACGDCLTAHETPGCQVSECEDIVCSFDDFCCLNEWDSACATEGQDFCQGEVCQ